MFALILLFGLIGFCLIWALIFSAVPRKRRRK